MNYKMTIQYDGTRYNGWQKQGNTENTIQGKLETLLSRLSGEPVEVQGAGRTDAGVHALGQVANAKFHTDLSKEELRETINRYLPEDIEVTELEPVPERFHSRLNAAEKTYVYRLTVDKRKHVFDRKYLYHYGKNLNLEAMKEAAEYLKGCHDFQSFCSARKSKKSTVRVLKEIRLEERDGVLSMTFTGNGFLYHMVRILSGTLIEVGEQKRKPASMKEILESRDRSRAGFLAPAEGLTLVSVLYKKEKENDR